ncbi:MAG: peptide chain release factor 1 [Oscillospiraceae bacterium]|nr:peptide chain release factor 1 [Oscillospiraceae bacterium]
MLDTLRGIEEKYNVIETQLADPEVYADPQAMGKLLKEQKALMPLMEAYKEYAAALQTVEESMEILNAGGDVELRELAQEELDAARAVIPDLEERMKILLLPVDPNDEKNVVMEVRAGVGGEESALFASALYRMYTMFAESNRWKVENLSVNDTELGGIKEISFLISGNGAYSRLKYESGVHRVQRVPDTETQGRIHTSAATVAVLPEAEDVDIEINPADLQIETMRASGAGGQHVNKTDSAIRMLHIPSGLVVECQDERSQHKNKDRALKILKTRLLDMERQKQTDEIAAARKGQVGSGDRSERIRTYNFPQSRVTDHRINLTLYKIDAIMNGELNEVVDALTTADQAEKLKGEE